MRAGQATAVRTHTARLLRFAESGELSEREKVTLTLGIGHHEVLADTDGGLAPDE